MALEALEFFDIHSASSGIDGAQVVILYFFRIPIVSFNRVTSKILVQLRDNYEVYT